MIARIFAILAAAIRLRGNQAATPTQVVYVAQVFERYIKHG